MTDRMNTFINSLDTGNPGFLNELEDAAREGQVPVIRPGVQSLLKTLIAVKQPGRILEIGTAVGFSALLMSHYSPCGCRIITVEKDERRIAEARENFKRAGKEEEITLLEGDAGELLPTLQGSFDLIFLDGAKGQYIYFLPELFRLLSERGILISDNVLQEGDILESRYAVIRRNRTIHARMREYLYALKHYPGLTTAILPVEDGVAVSVKTERQE